jgi:hypothetical protein
MSQNSGSWISIWKLVTKASKRVVYFLEPLFSVTKAFIQVGANTLFLKMKLLSCHYNLKEFAPIPLFFRFQN